MVAQSHEARRDRAAPRHLGVSILMEVIVVQNVAVEQPALLGRRDDDPGSLD